MCGQDITEVKPKMTMLLTAAAMAYDKGFRDIPGSDAPPPADEEEEAGGGVKNEAVADSNGEVSSPR